MSWFEEAKKITVNDFGGAVPLLEASDIPLGKAIEASNVIFRPGRVETRPGFGFALPADGEQRELYSWSQGLLGGAIDWLAYLCDGVAIKIRNLASPLTAHTIASGLPPSSRASFASWGQRLYAALQSSALRGVYHAQVWDGDPTHQMANCFQRPLTLTSELTLILNAAVAPGSVTAGSHWVGAIFQTVEGFWTKPSPAFSPSLEFAPMPVNCVAGGNIVATFVPATTWPSWITKVQLVMTTASNASQFYLVPGSQTDISAYRGLANPFSLTIDIDDATLREADPADDYFDLITQDYADAAPFLPFGVCTWGNRLVWFANYGGIDSILISEQENPEWITASQHVLHLPGGVPISGWFVLRGSLYVLSSAGKTYAFSDNGSKPVDFPVPVEIDANIGTPSSGAVTAIGGSSGYALVASPQGLYIFAGTNYPQIPLSYLQTPRWEQIDWSAIEEMKLMDFTKERLILFRCKMLDSTYRMLTWSYSSGFSSDKSNYSEWFLWETKGMPGVVHRSHLSSGQELWIGAGSIVGDRAIRLKVENYDPALTFHLDSTAFPPGSFQIPWWYQIGPFPPRSQGQMLHHLGCRLRLDGEGRIYVRPVKMTDGAWGSAPSKVADIPIDIIPGQPFYDIVLDDPIESPSEREVEAIFWLIGNAETGAGGTWAEMLLPWSDTNIPWDSLAAIKGWIKLSTLIHLHTPYLERR